MAKYKMQGSVSRHPDGVAVSRHPDGVAVIPNLFRDLWNLERMAGFSVLVISAMGSRSVASSGAR